MEQSVIPFLGLLCLRKRAEEMATGHLDVPKAKNHDGLTQETHSWA